MLTSLFSLFYVTCEFHRFLPRLSLPFFVSEIFKFFYYVNLVTDDVIGCAMQVQSGVTQN